MAPTLTLLLYASLAAGATILGALPLVRRERIPTRWIGGANALAAGLMLGAAYALSKAGRHGQPAELAFGAVLGVLFIFWTHRVSDTENLDLTRLRESDPVYGYQVLLVNALHAASEGVAIGVAMAVSTPFGLFMAVSIGVHNIPEGTILCAVLRSRGMRLGEAAGLAVAANVGQVLLALVTHGLVVAAPAMLPAAGGFAIGSLIYLVLVELLPESYRQAGATTIAVVTTVAMGALVLLSEAAK
jgi:ZIP family zinc transporter